MPFDSLEDYIIYKGIHALVISNYYDKVFMILSQIVAFDINVLETVRDITYYYVDFMDEKIENNVVRIINYYRNDYVYQSNEEKQKIFNICNDIIIKINSTANNKSIKKLKEHIIVEYKARGFNISNKLIKGVNKIPYAYFELVKDYNFTDFRILIFNNEIVSEQDFIEYLQNFSSDNFFFINCLKLLLDEYPNLLENPVFKNRIKISLQIFKDYIDNNEIFNDKTKNIINNHYKVYMKKIEEPT